MQVTMNSIKAAKAALIDLSGTLHIENSAIYGAQEALSRLRKSGMEVKFVTNTTKESKRLLHERLQNLGFDIDKSEIFTSLTAAHQKIQHDNLRPMLLLEDCAKEDFQGVDEESPNAVVIGLSPSYFDYQHMTKAFRLLLDDAKFIAIHKARYYKKTDGLYLGPGAFVSGLEYATGKVAEVVGKPEATFFNEAVKEFDVNNYQVVMIGDDVRDDVNGAMRAGMMGILVKTGKYRENDEHTVNPKPTAVCEDFTKAVDFLLDKK